MEVDDPSRNRKSEPSTVARIGTKERLENARQIILCHTLTTAGDRNQSRISVSLHSHINVDPSGANRTAFRRTFSMALRSMSDHRRRADLPQPLGRSRMRGQLFASLLVPRHALGVVVTTAPR
jgi:hypothetical protein